MFQLLLVILYLSFISLGLPDSVLGAAWPSMYGQLKVPVSYAGIVSMIIAGGTIISSLFSSKVIGKLGTELVTAISVAMTAVALIGFSFSNRFWMLCLWSIPYGLGAGSVDAALNNYVALHYKSRHMSWLHCFWGLGATAGPYILGWCLTGGGIWNDGYRTIGFIQIVLVAILFCSLPLWKKDKEEAREETEKSVGMRGALKIPGAKEVLAAFFCYCALESTAGLWASSYMVLDRGIDATKAASWASMYYLGITVGRFICGFVSDRLGDKLLVRIGQCAVFIGILMLLLPFGSNVVFCGMCLIGLGSAPIYPSFIHATPENFGAANSRALIGLQMACAYTGSTLMPPVLGFLAQYISIKLYPFYLLLLVAGMFIMAERMNRLTKKK